MPENQPDFTINPNFSKIQTQRVLRQPKPFTRGKAVIPSRKPVKPVLLAARLLSLAAHLPSRPAVEQVLLGMLEAHLRAAVRCSISSVMRHTPNCIAKYQLYYYNYLFYGLNECTCILWPDPASRYSGGGGEGYSLHKRAEVLVEKSDKVA